MRVERLVIEAGENSFTLDLHPRLTVVAGMGRVEITAWRYKDIHGGERDYVILPGHTRIAGEEIMEENSYYEIVKKAA